MTPLAVFLHTAMIISLGPLLAGWSRVAASGGGLPALMAPSRRISAGLRASGQPPLGHLAALALAIVAGLLIPLFSSDAVLGFLGDGFTALLLLTGLSARYLPIRASGVLAVAASLWALGTLSGSTDLAQALAFWEAGPASWLIFLGLALGTAPMICEVGAPPARHSRESGNPVAPVFTGVTGSESGSDDGMSPPASEGESAPGLNEALAAWTRSTLQLGWLALGMMAFPVTIPLTSWPTFAAALALFGIKLIVLGGLAAFVSARWPKLPLAELGFACSLLALALVKLGA